MKICIVVRFVAGKYQATFAETLGCIGHGRTPHEAIGHLVMDHGSIFGIGFCFIEKDRPKKSHLAVRAS